MTIHGEQDQYGVPALQIDGLIFHKNGTFIESACTEDFFWLRLSATVGYARFAVMPELREPGAPRTFQLLEVRPANLPAPHQLVSVSGVLWSRRAAREADRVIASYLSGLDPMSNPPANQFKQGVFVELDRHNSENRRESAVASKEVHSIFRDACWLIANRVVQIKRHARGDEPVFGQIKEVRGTDVLRHIADVFCVTETRVDVRECEHYFLLKFPIQFHVGLVDVLSMAGAA